MMVLYIITGTLRKQGKSKAKFKVCVTFPHKLS